MIVNIQNKPDIGFGKLVYDILSLVFGGNGIKWKSQFQEFIKKNKRRVLIFDSSKTPKYFWPVKL